MRTLAMDEIVTTRLVLSALGPGDALEMSAVLADERLYEFIGGGPPTEAELWDRYLRLGAGSGRPDEIWLNWIVRLRDTGQAVGTVQATVKLAVEIALPGAVPPTGAAQAAARADAARTAWVAWAAWVIGASWQGHGYASEAATGLVNWLRGQGVSTVSAAIHPDNLPSAAVARRVGLVPTAAELDGEQVWSLPAQ